MVAPVSARAFAGTLLHVPTRGKLELLHDALVTVDADGKILQVFSEDCTDRDAITARHGADGTLHTLGAGQYLLPGLVDLHVHAPQWPQLGSALDQPLENWLQHHTFPLEARCADVVYAEAVYDGLVSALLGNGTTTALYYASIHLPATQRLADICLKRSQRALIGRVAMDNAEQCPAYYRDASAAAAEADTRALIHYVSSMPGNAGRVLPVITPRFIPSCTDDLLHRLGALARDSGCHVQTHCSESDWEHRYVLGRCGDTDTHALDSFGLLTRRTILAHCNFIDGDDVEKIVGIGAGVAHCPLSNVYFSDAVFPLRRLLERGVHVGLGTDIAGGASASIMDNAKYAVIASRLLESGVDPALEREQRRREGARIDAVDAFWLATTGGGIALDLPIGAFLPGYHFDAIVVDANVACSNLQVGAGASPEDLLQRLVYNTARANIRQVWVAGRAVHATDA